MKYWSEVDACWYECEAGSVNGRPWDGRGPVTSGDGWMYRRSYLAQTDAQDGGLKRFKSKARRETRCPQCCGRMTVTPGSARTICSGCADPDRKLKRCACGRRFRTQDAVRCKTCRKSGRTVSRPAQSRGYAMPRKKREAA